MLISNYLNDHVSSNGTFLQLFFVIGKSKK